eukprot:TRINITY_DN2671_c0_g1_i2.p1 TRINITY_DN2671_c0_g1~~TRINITY_DN2671_c0_g1_i2.p1  ORF type:complete len:105 (+),score=24.74 TRINITY_DN2671_c0_g1_i2:351-665(+)
MAKNAFVGDPVCHKILFVSVLEESVTNQCTTGKIVGGPHSVEEFQQGLANHLPQMMSQLQQKLRQNPEAVKNMTPEQQKMLRGMINLQRRIQSGENPLQISAEK